jgi:hypothetical protein
VTRSKASLLLFALTGCLHRSPDAAILAPLAAHLAREPSEQSKEPEYLIFADQLTATVFKSLRRDARYKIVPSSTQLVCPSKAAVGLQGYALRASVSQVMGDSAVATVERICRSGQLIITGENYLLIRRGGKWRMDTIISGFTNVAM